MSRFQLIAFLLLIPAIPSLLPAAGMHGRHWQEGEIVSRKTISPGHHNTQIRYVYRIRSGGMQYTARFNEPLTARPYAPLSFSVEGRHLLVQDPDGSERKADILKKSEPSLRH